MDVVRQDCDRTGKQQIIEALFSSNNALFTVALDRKWARSLYYVYNITSKDDSTENAANFYYHSLSQRITNRNFQGFISISKSTLPDSNAIRRASLVNNYYIIS